MASSSSSWPTTFRYGGGMVACVLAAGACSLVVSTDNLSGGAVDAGGTIDTGPWDSAQSLEDARPLSEVSPPPEDTSKTCPTDCTFSSCLAGECVVRAPTATLGAAPFAIEGSDLYYAEGLSIYRLQSSAPEFFTAANGTVNLLRAVSGKLYGVEGSGLHKTVVEYGPNSRTEQTSFDAEKSRGPLAAALSGMVWDAPLSASVSSPTIHFWKPGEGVKVVESMEAGTRIGQLAGTSEYVIALVRVAQDGGGEQSRLRVYDSNLKRRAERTLASANYIVAGGAFVYVSETTVRRFSLPNMELENNYDWGNLSDIDANERHIYFMTYSDEPGRTTGKVFYSPVSDTTMSSTLFEYSFVPPLTKFPGIVLGPSLGVFAIADRFYRFRPAP